MRLNATIFFLIIFACCKPSENIEELKKNFILDGGIYIEKVLPSDSSQNRYTIDNKIYTPNRKFIFDYYILQQGDTLKITAPKMIGPEDDFDRTWDFIPKNETHPDKVETISITVLNGISNDQQTLVRYDYQYSYQLDFVPYNSTSGVIENEINVWIHPHRDKYFGILELNPFPFIQKPYKIGNRWKWTLGIGDHWQDKRWKSWTGDIQNNYEYEIIGRQTLDSKIGKIDCWIIQGIATNEIGTTGLIGYFNEEIGFVKLDYINIDKSKLIIEIKDAR